MASEHFSDLTIKTLIVPVHMKSNAFIGVVLASKLVTYGVGYIVNDDEVEHVEFVLDVS